MARDLIRRDENGKKIIPENKLIENVKATDAKQKAFNPNVPEPVRVILAQIRMKRLELNVKQTEMAEFIEVEREQYSRLEAGASRMSLEQFVLVCNKLGLSISIT